MEHCIGVLRNVWRVVRLYRNRMSAKQSRERKKAFADLLEEQIQKLSDAKGTLEQAIAQLLWENEQLRMGQRCRQPNCPPQ